MPEVLSRNGNDESLGGGAVEFFREVENFLGRIDVGKLPRFLTWRAVVGSNLSNANVTGIALLDIVHVSGSYAGRINEKNEFVVLGRVREFWGELMQSNDFDFGFRESLRENIGGAPGNAVIAAQRVSVGDDEDAGHVQGKQFVILRATALRGTLRHSPCLRQSKGTVVLHEVQDLPSTASQIYTDVWSFTPASPPLRMTSL